MNMGNRFMSVRMNMPTSNRVEMGMIMMTVIMPVQMLMHLSSVCMAM
jgi:hypothetical protein